MVTGERDAMDSISRGEPLTNAVVDAEAVRLFSRAYGVSIREIARRMGRSNTYLSLAINHGKRVSAEFATQLVVVLEEIARTRPLAPYAIIRYLPAISEPAASTALVPAPPSDSGRVSDTATATLSA